MFFGNQVVLFDVGTLGVVMHYGGTLHGNKAKIMNLESVINVSELLLQLNH